MLMEHSGNETTNHCATKTKQRWCQWNEEKVKLKNWYMSSKSLSPKLISNKLSQMKVYDWTDVLN